MVCTPFWRMMRFVWRQIGLIARWGGLHFTSWSAASMKL